MLFLSAMGGLDLYGGLGGQVGWALNTPLSGLFGEVISAVIISALVLVGVLLTFDTNLSLPNIFSKFKK